MRDVVSYDFKGHISHLPFFYIILIGFADVNTNRHSKATPHSRQKLFIDRLSGEDAPATPEEYRAHYRCFASSSFAFADIAMEFSQERYAVDWIFRYGNPALARLEKIPPKTLIGSTFRSLFTNMDPKWLRCCEQAALYGKTPEIVSYSPEIDTNLKIICYPTFKGHCGCILFHLDAASTR